MEARVWVGQETQLKGGEAAPGNNPSLFLLPQEAPGVPTSHSLCISSEAAHFKAVLAWALLVFCCPESRDGAGLVCHRFPSRQPGAWHRPGTRAPRWLKE